VTLQQHLLDYGSQEAGLVITFIYVSKVLMKTHMLQYSILYETIMTQYAGIQFALKSDG